MPRIGSILPNSLSNGPGCRLTIFFAGCNHLCEGCHNKHLWPLNSGTKMNIHEIYDAINNNIDMIDGITISGGEPFLQPKSLFRIVHYAKIKKNLNVWCYSGFTINELLAMDNRYVKYALRYINVLVDGKFIEELHEENIQWRGSSNQNIVDLANILSNVTSS